VLQNKKRVLSKQNGMMRKTTTTRKGIVVGGATKVKEAVNRALRSVTFIEV
jgi:hypothetical protein